MSCMKGQFMELEDTNIQVFDSNFLNKSLALIVHSGAASSRESSYEEALKKKYRKQR